MFVRLINCSLTDFKKTPNMGGKMKDVARFFYWEVFDAEMNSILISTDQEKAIRAVPKGGTVFDVVKVLLEIDEKTFVTTITHKEIL